MGSKIFKLTAEEIENQKDEKTRKIAISGETWEEATRFCMEDAMRTLSSKSKKGIIIHYIVVWPDNPDKVFEDVPVEVYDAFKEPLDKNFIEFSIKQSREFIRNT